MLARIRATGAPVLLLDTGNVAVDEYQAGTIAAIMRRQAYDAVGIGPLDLPERARFAETLRLHELLPLSVPAGKPPLAPPAWRPVERGGIMVGVATAGFADDPAAPAYRRELRAVLQQARQQAQAVVLMSHLGRPADEALLGEGGLSEFVDVLIGGQDTWFAEAPKSVGGTLLVSGTRKGRQIGMLRTTLAGTRPAFEPQMLELRLTLAEDPETKAAVEEYFAQRAALLLQEAQSAPARPDPGTPALPEVYSPEEAAAIRARGYLTAPECGRCHTAQQEQWATTTHAQALQTLVDRRRLAPECLQCHDEARRRGLPYEPERADQYAVDCASCHGSGLLHAANPAANQPVRLPSEALCSVCHQKEHSKDFDYATYVPLVTH